MSILEIVWAILRKTPSGELHAIVFDGFGLIAIHYHREFLDLIRQSSQREAVRMLSAVLNQPALIREGDKRIELMVFIRDSDNVPGAVRDYLDWAFRVLGCAYNH